MKEELGVLRDIHQVLEIAHATQEALLAELTPTLSMALPLYELLVQKWTRLATHTLPELSHYINLALNKLRDYIREARKTRIYALSLILNPDVKFDWMTQYWDEEDVVQARGWILESMTAYRTFQRKSGQQALFLPNTTTASRAAQAQARAAQRLSCINVDIRRSTSLSSIISSSSSPSPSPTPSNTTEGRQPTAEELAEREVKAVEEDCKDARRELEQYEHELPALNAGEHVTDLVRYWERMEKNYPLLFCVAMDILPAQASSVPCERVQFSSSKETNSLRRSRMSPELMEALQILKFSIRQDRLCFTRDFVAKEEDYAISGPVTQRAMEELIHAGKLDELQDLVRNSIADEDEDEDSTILA